MINLESARGATDQLPAIRLTFLGQFTAEEVNGEPLPAIKQQKLIGILVLAALSPTRSVPAAHAVRLLWSDSDTRLAKRSLNQLLHQTRRLYPALLVRTRTDDRLVLGDGVSSDLAEALAGTGFEQAAVPPDRQSCELLPGFAISGCDEFADLLDTARGRVALALAKAALRRAPTVSGSERLAWVGLAYSLDRTSEDTAIAYLGEVASAEGNAACWAAFTTHRAWLSERYDLAPSTSLTRAVLELCRAEPPATAAARPASPAAGTSAEAEVGQAPFRAVAPAPVRRFGSRSLQAVATLAVLALLSWVVVKVAGSPRLAADATSSAAALRFEYGSGDPTMDSAVLAVVEHLASHGIRAEARAVNSVRAAAGVLLSAGTGDPHLIPLDAAASGSALAHEQAVLFDSALALITGEPDDQPAARDEGGSAQLAEARARLDDGLQLARSGGAHAGLLMLASADSSADAARRAEPSDWRAPLLQSEITRHAFVMKYASGAGADAPQLRKAVELASESQRRGGGTEALIARADADYALWIFGLAGAEEAARDAVRDYSSALRQEPHNSTAWSRLADLYQSQGRLSDAYTAALQSLENAPGRHDEQSYMALFMTSLDLKDNQRAGRWCDELAFHYPRGWGAAACAVMTAWADSSVPVPAPGALYDAPTAIRPLLERRLALLTAGAQLARGEIAAATAALDRLLPAMSDDPEAEPILAGILVEQGQPDSARVLLQRYMSATPARRSAQYRPWLDAIR